MLTPTALEEAPGAHMPIGDVVWTEWKQESLLWMPERGMGYYPIRERAYDAEYFEKYRRYSETELGRRITEGRSELVDQYEGDGLGPVIDVGIGCGAFLEERWRTGRGETYGYDINPVAVEWLQARDCYRNPYVERGRYSLTLWDVLEHVSDPGRLVRSVPVGRQVFTCLPIFRDADHVLGSKHYRKDEHRWYWTRDGLVEWFGASGFVLMEEGQPEVELGREDISTFVFRRVNRG